MRRTYTKPEVEYLTFDYSNTVASTPVPYSTNIYNDGTSFDEIQNDGSGQSVAVPGDLTKAAVKNTTVPLYSTDDGLTTYNVEEGNDTFASTSTEAATEAVNTAAEVSEMGATE